MVLCADLGLVSNTHAKLKATGDLYQADSWSLATYRTYILNLTHLSSNPGIKYNLSK